MKYLTNKILNVVVTILISGICFVILHKSDLLDGSGMAAIFLNWIPIIIGLFTIVAYFITNAFTKKYAWIVTVLGNIFNLVIVLKPLLEAS